MFPFYDVIMKTTMLSDGNFKKFHCSHMIIKDFSVDNFNNISRYFREYWRKIARNIFERNNQQLLLSASPAVSFDSIIYESYFPSDL